MPSRPAHDPEKWKPVFGKDHAQSKSCSVKKISGESSTQLIQTGVSPCIFRVVDRDGSSLRARILTACASRDARIAARVLAGINPDDRAPTAGPGQLFWGFRGADWILSSARVRETGSCGRPRRRAWNRLAATPAGCPLIHSSQKPDKDTYRGRCAATVNEL